MNENKLILKMGEKNKTRAIQKRKHAKYLKNVIQECHNRNFQNIYIKDIYFMDFFFLLTRLLPKRTTFHQICHHVLVGRNSYSFLFLISNKEQTASVGL